MTETQKFKGDAEELKFEASGEPILSALEAQLDLFFAGAYEAEPLGDVLHDLGASPLANAIKKSIFRQCFNTIFESFVFAGSFESYLTVFRRIFGDDVEVTFTVPAPGKLNIDIVAAELETSFFIAREIVSGSYVFGKVQYRDTVDAPAPSGYILFRTIKGFATQYELEQMLFEMVPGGIFTQITLSFGG